MGMNIVMQGAGNNFEVDPPDIHARIEFEKDDDGDLTRAWVKRQEVEPIESGLWRYLSYQLQPTETKEIAQTLNLSLPQVRVALSKLQELGRVTCIDEDWWRACEQKSDEVPAIQ
jgi:predicted Rossmann fold nucleotide-binding protein DprA/Smf involved in DNA uptake